MHVLNSPQLYCSITMIADGVTPPVTEATMRFVLGSVNLLTLCYYDSVVSSELRIMLL